MIIDRDHLLVKADGNGGDTLQVSGFAGLGFFLKFGYLPEFGTQAAKLCYIGKGKWVRHPKPVLKEDSFWKDPGLTTRDQLLSAFVLSRLSNNWRVLLHTTFALMMRVGFAQNTRSTDGKIRIPDFMHPFLGLVIRSWFPLSLPLYPLLIIFDLCLLVGILLDCFGPTWVHEKKKFAKRNPNDTDDDNAVLQLAVAVKWMPTPISFLARKTHARFRPWSYGCTDAETLDIAKKRPHGSGTHSPVFGALRWKHRSESTGDPEVAALWKDSIERFWGKA